MASMIPFTWDKDVDHLKKSEIVFFTEFTVYINNFIFWFNSPAEYVNLSGIQYRKKLNRGCNHVVRYPALYASLHILFYTFCCSTLYAQIYFQNKVMKLQNGNEITLIKLIFHSLNKSAYVWNNHICFVLMDII